MTSINTSVSPVYSLLGIQPKKQPATLLDAITPSVSPVAPIKALSGNQTLQIPSDVLTLLQNFQPGSAAGQQVTDLTGGNALVTDRNNISSTSFYNALNVAYQSALQRNADITASTNPLASLLSSSQAAERSQNSALLEEAKQTLANIKANPLVA